MDEGGSTAFRGLAGQLLFFAPLFLSPETAAIPGGRDFVQGELKKLGKMTVGEINVIVSFVCMVLLFTGPSVLSLALGVDHLDFGCGLLPAQRCAHLAGPAGPSHQGG